MAKFIIKEDFWSLFPQAEIGVILATGVDNRLEANEAALNEIQDLLAAANIEAKKYLVEDVFSENMVVAPWR